MTNAAIPSQFCRERENAPLHDRNAVRWRMRRRLSIEKNAEIQEKPPDELHNSYTGILMLIYDR
jgi:hypothetical protein